MLPSVVVKAPQVILVNYWVANPRSECGRPQGLGVGGKILKGRTKVSLLLVEDSLVWLELRPHLRVGCDWCCTELYVMKCGGEL